MESKNYQIIDDVHKFEEAFVRIRKAQAEFATFSQEQVDKIFLAAASAAESPSQK